MIKAQTMQIMGNRHFTWKAFLTKRKRFRFILLRKISTTICKLQNIWYFLDSTYTPARISGLSIATKSLKPAMLHTQWVNQMFIAQFNYLYSLKSCNLQRLGVVLSKGWPFLLSSTSVSPSMACHTTLKVKIVSIDESGTEGTKDCVYKHV